MDVNFEPFTVYHIYNAANGEENLFREAKNYDFFIDKYVKYVNPVAETYAYCLMPNHFHAMICTRSEEEVRTFQKFETFGKLVSHQFARLFSSYAQAFNKVYSRRGSLFKPNVKKKPVTSDEYFTQLILYIHNNPVKHGFVKDPWDWPYSSIHETFQKFKTFGKLSPTAKQTVIDWFGSVESFKGSHRNIDEIKSVFD